MHVTPHPNEGASDAPSFTLSHGGRGNQRFDMGEEGVTPRSKIMIDPEGSGKPHYLAQPDP